MSLHMFCFVFFSPPLSSRMLSVSIRLNHISSSAGDQPVRQHMDPQWEEQALRPGGKTEPVSGCQGEGRGLRGWRWEEGGRGKHWVVVDEVRRRKVRVELRLHGRDDSHTVRSRCSVCVRVFWRCLVRATQSKHVLSEQQAVSMLKKYVMSCVLQAQWGNLGASSECFSFK